MFTQLPYSEYPNTTLAGYAGLKFCAIVKSESIVGKMKKTGKGKPSRQIVRRFLRQWLRFSSLALTTVALSSPAIAQLRTGRDADRDFYPAQSSPLSTSESPNVRKPAIVTPRLKKQVRDDVVPASHVEQSSCKNCQQPALSDSHNSITSTDSNEFIFESHEPSPTLNYPNCNSGCAPFNDAPPVGFLSQLLRRSQLRFEAVTFWPQGQDLPQLVTTRRPANDPATDGLIGAPDTTNLFGGSESLGQSSQGTRGEFGTYLDACRTTGILLRYFDAGSISQSYSSTPTSEPVVTRPFFDSTSNAQATIAINYPGSTSGSLDARISNELYGGDILFRKLILKDCAGRVEFLAGYQTARLADDLRISSTTTALTNTPAPVGTISQLSDHFSTTNRFNGMALGLNGILRERAWTLSGMIKLGFGNMEQSVKIDGSSTITVPGTPASINSTTNGLLARSTNDGNYVFNTFIVSPETNVTLGYRLTHRLQATLGYTYLGLPKVARVADQLDPQLASNLSNPLSGPIRPGFSLKESNFSLHSLNYGLQWRY